jgi:hypothetical protein
VVTGDALQRDMINRTIGAPQNKPVSDPGRKFTFRTGQETRQEIIGLVQARLAGFGPITQGGQDQRLERNVKPEPGSHHYPSLSIPAGASDRALGIAERPETSVIHAGLAAH